MGWIDASSVPSSLSWSSWVTGATKTTDLVAYRTQARIARGSTNTVYIQVRIQAYCRNYDSSPLTVSMKAQVSIGNTSSYSTSSEVTAAVDFGTDDNAMQNVGSRYYQDTLAKGGKAYARTYLSGSSQSGSVTLTGPGYTTTYPVTYSSNTPTPAYDYRSKTYNETFTIGDIGSWYYTGYAFDRWNTAANGSGTNWYPGEQYTANAALTLYAVWVPNTYTIKYYSNTPTEATATQTKTYGRAEEIRGSMGWIYNGRTFTGWNTARNGSGKHYDPGDMYTGNANLSLYAEWQTITYPVTYDGNGADSGVVAPQTKTWGVNLTLQQNGFTRKGCAFTGWNTAPDGTGDSYAGGGTYSANAAATMYAQWVRTNIPAYVNVNGTICQVDQAYANVGGVIKECDVYVNVDGAIVQII